MLALLLALSLDLTHDPKPLAPEVETRATGRLLTDQQEDGTVWVRGENYKLALGAMGARFIPRERHAQRNHQLELQPVELSIAGQSVAVDRLAAPVLDQQRVVFDRGTLQEVWDLEPLGARQSFVLRERPAAGELVLRLPLGGDVLFEQDAAEGLRFRSPEGGQVHYGDLLAFDAAGHVCQSPSELVGQSIQLRLSAAFLAEASFPLTIDPFVSTISVDTGSDDPLNPDSAADQTSGKTLVVYADAFSNNDTDIISRRFNTTGNLDDEVAVEISDDETIDPAVANYETLDQFLIVWTNTGAGLFNTRRIEGRTREAGSATQGNKKNFSFGQGQEATPDVGGPDAGVTGYYFVVWSEKGTFTEQNIRGRRMSKTGNLGPSLFLNDKNGDQLNPAISQSCDALGRFVIVYEDLVSASSTVIRAATVLADGTAGQNFSDDLGSGTGTDSRPAVAGERDEFLIVYEHRQSNGDRDIFGTRLSFAGATPTAAGFNLSAIEPGADSLLQQFAPAVALTVNGFVYAYEERQPGSSSNFDIFTAALDFDLFEPSFFEGHVLVSLASSAPDNGVSMGSNANGLRCYPVWTRSNSGGDTDVVGAIYQIP